MNSTIQKNFQENLEIAQMLPSFEKEVEQIAQEIITCLKNGHKLIFLGNGGSAADAIHMAEEYVGISSKTRIRRGLPAIALTENISTITAIANDWDYHYIFWRQLKAIAEPGDLVICFTTSGESKNVVYAVKYCKKQGIKTISFTGSQKNTVADLSDIVFRAHSRRESRIQETYMFVNHILCELVDEAF